MPPDRIWTRARARPSRMVQTSLALSEWTAYFTTNGIINFNASEHRVLRILIWLTASIAIWPDASHCLSSSHVKSIISLDRRKLLPMKSNSCVFIHIYNALRTSKDVGIHRHRSDTLLSIYTEYFRIVCLISKCLFACRLCISVARPTNWRSMPSAVNAETLNSPYGHHNATLVNCEQMNGPGENDPNTVMKLDRCAVAYSN